MEDREKIMTKLEALLRMKTERGASQSEMETTMRLAQRLAFKHRINLDEVVPDNEGSIKVGINMVKRTMRTLSPEFHVHLCRILNKYYGVRMVLAAEGMDRVHVIGTETDVDFAIYAYAFLRVTFKQLWEWQKFEDQLTDRSRKDFYHGLWEGLDKKLSEEKVKMEHEATVSNCRSIVLVDEHKAALDKAMVEYFPQSRNKRSSIARINDLGAYNAGKEVGASIGVNKAIGGGSTRI